MEALPLPAILVIIIGLILARLGLVQAKRRGRSGSDMADEYIVKWNRERLRFPLPSPDTNLGEIRHAIAEYTQLPRHGFKLVHAGSVMKDDNVPISTYGIRRNSTIALIGDGSTASVDAAQTRRAEPAPRTEQGTVDQIRAEMDKVRKLSADLNTFLSSLPTTLLPTATTTAAPPVGSAAEKTTAGAGITQEQEKEHLRLGELLLQSLLRLDSVVAEGEWTEARRERKGAVKEVQELLDRLDAEWKTAKAAVSARP